MQFKVLMIQQNMQNKILYTTVKEFVTISKRMKIYKKINYEYYKKSIENKLRLYFNKVLVNKS